MFSRSASHSTLLFLNVLACLPMLFVKSSSLQRPNSTNSPSSAEEKVCASVILASGGRVDLYENGILSTAEYESVQDSKLKRAIFEVPVSLCVLEICGFSETNNPASIEPYKYGTCEWHYGTRVRAPSAIYDPDFQTSSMSCGCSIFFKPFSFLVKKNETDCDQATCQTASANWNGMQCAILYQEKDCQSCYFQSFILEYGKQFLSLNSFQIKAIKVRNGCTVEKYTNGAIGYTIKDLEPFQYRGIDNDTGSVFHKDSENYTCYCDKELITEMNRATTTTTKLPFLTYTSNNDSVEPPTTLTPKRDDEDEESVTMIVLMYVLPAIIGFVLLVLGLATIIYYCYCTPGKTEKVFTKNHSNGEVDKRADVEMQELPVVSGLKGGELEPESQYREQELKRMFEDWLSSLRDNSQKQWHIPFLPPKFPMGLHVDDNALMDNFKLVCDADFEVEWKRISIDLDNPLGSGHFGLVYDGFCEYESDGLKEHVAIKTIKPHSGQHIIMSFLREIKILQCIGNHKNIVRYVGSSCHGGQLFILTEFCDNGSLREYLKEVISSRIVISFSVQLPPESRTSDEYVDGGIETDNSGESEEEQNHSNEKSASLTESDLHQLVCWSEQIATGMEFLNSRKIIHVDLAVRNILLASDLTAKICDFGLSKTCIEEKYYAQSLLIGDIPVNYFAPDWINNSQMREDGQKKVSVFIDIWAYGCTVWEIFSLGVRPYYGMDGEGIKDFVKRKQRLEKPQLSPDFVYTKLLECWSEMPEDRPSFTELKKYFYSERTKILQT